MLANKMMENKFTLLVSLPKNNIEYAKAAMEAGADGVKVHIHAFHYASNQKYGSLETEVDFFKELSALAKEKNVLIGIVPGDGGDYAIEDEFAKLKELGFDFVSTYVDFAPVCLLTSKKFDLCAALSADTPLTATDLDRLGVDIIEASVVSHDGYRNKLTVLDLCKYSHVVSQTTKPVLIPTQKDIAPHEVSALYNVGCKGIMIGAVVFKDLSIEGFKSTVSQFRSAIDQLV